MVALFLEARGFFKHYITMSRVLSRKNRLNLDLLALANFLQQAVLTA
jgi:hypothetical protein